MIDYSLAPQNNVYAASTPQFQDWGPYAPGSFQDYDIIIEYAPNSGQPVPTPTVNFKILDVIGNPLYSNYTEFRLRSIGHHLGTSGVLWLNPACVADFDMGYEGAEIIPITENGLTYTLSPTLRNLDLLTFDHDYYYSIQRIMQGKNAAGVWEPISFYTATIILKYSSATVTMVPNRLNFSVIQGFEHETKPVNIYGANWRLTSNDNFDLSVVSGDVEILDEPSVEGDPDSPIEKRFYGTGNAVLNVTPGAYFDTCNPAEAYVWSFSVLTLLPGGSEYVNFVGLIYNQVFINTDEVLISTPKELYFEGAKAFGNPPAQYITYSCTNPTYAISSSPWIITNDVIINVNGIDRTAIEVKMIPNANLNVGTYQGVVQIQSVIKGVSESQYTKVFYKLSDFVDLPYAAAKRAFTLDKEFVQFATENADTYMQFNIVAKVYDFFTNIDSLVTIPQKIALFQGKAELNVGRTIHQIMKRFAGITNSEYQYRIAQVYFTCEERKYLDNAIVRQVQSDTISFVAGLSHPDKDMTILDINLKPNRVTQQSYAYLNLLLISASSAIEVLLNGQFYELLDVPFSTDILITKKITFSDFAIGDVISYRLVPTAQSRTIITGPTDTSMIKVFKMFDIGNHSNQITWQDEYLLKHTIECTGIYKIQTDFEFQTQTLFQQLTEVLEVVDSSKTVKLTINTGWLLKSDTDTIESLMRAPRIWLEQGDTAIDLRPAGKSIINEDSERELIEFTLEFTINKKYNEETYSL